MLLELLRAQARDRPDAAAVIEADGTAWRFSDIVDRGEGAARWLAREDVTRFAVQTHSFVDILAIAAGASLVGTESCTYDPDLSSAQTAALSAQFGHDVLIRGAPDEIEGRRVVAVGDANVRSGPLPGPAPHSPLIILTTGTTGHQQGARHEWRRLFRAARGRPQAPASRWLLAYNLHQFAGVQMLVHVLAVNGTFVVPSSKRPRDALEALRRHKVTHVSATPTFWRFLLAEMGPVGASLPAPALEQITLGGEAVDGRLLADLRRVFPGVRVSQVYGATEFGTGVSVRDGESGLPATVLERGPDADVRFKIIDDEMWVASRVGMLGYYGEEPEELDADTPRWRPTGDRVEVRGDRIVFLGRTSETINVGGVKVHPLPIEEVIGRVRGVHVVRVYGRSNPVTGRIVAADVVPTAGTDPALLEDTIRDACAELGPAARPRRIRIVESLETRGDKLSRAPQVSEEA
jgi:acyl-CoA synthetase (AMP-forming)/AMP-acid ligase II